MQNGWQVFVIVAAIVALILIPLAIYCIIRQLRKQRSVEQQDTVEDEERSARNSKIDAPEKVETVSEEKSVEEPPSQSKVTGALPPLCHSQKSGPEVSEKDPFSQKEKDSERSVLFEAPPAYQKNRSGIFTPTSRRRMVQVKIPIQQQFTSPIMETSTRGLRLESKVRKVRKRKLFKVDEVEDKAVKSENDEKKGDDATAVPSDLVLEEPTQLSPVQPVERSTATNSSAVNGNDAGHTPNPTTTPGVGGGTLLDATIMTDSQRSAISAVERPSAIGGTSTTGAGVTGATGGSTVIDFTVPSANTYSNM